MTKNQALAKLALAHKLLQEVYHGDGIATGFTHAMPLNDAITNAGNAFALVSRMPDDPDA